MLHSLDALASGQLDGATEIKISAHLTEFPDALYRLSHSLEKLDLSNNQLTQLPDDLHRFKRLKIFFASNNPFQRFPDSLGQCPNLEMIGFKANKIQQLSETALPPKTRWLILTDNQLKTLPSNIGQLKNLQKLMLAGNQLKALPNSLENCHNLQLLRISANQLDAFPKCLLSLPKLAWLAFSGNPFCQPPNAFGTTLPKRPLNEFTLGNLLGEGASGQIYQATDQQSKPHLQEAHCQVAIKLFKGEITSDGYPKDELAACLLAGQHPNLVQMHAQLLEENQQGLVMALIPPHFKNLGLPPSLESCTRDQFPANVNFTPAQIIKIIKDVIGVVIHLHQTQICHGDLYAHNLLVDNEHKCLLTDFGAASSFQKLSKTEQHTLQIFESRALGHLLEDLMQLCNKKEPTPKTWRNLEAIHQTLLNSKVPSLEEIHTQLSTLIS